MKHAAGGAATAPGKPFSGDALAALRLDWGAAYEIGYDGEDYWALRRDGLGGLITDGTPDGLLRQVRENHAVRPVKLPDPEIAAIEAGYPGWRVWRSDRGHWYAVRQGPAGRWTRRDREWVTLDAPDAAGLRARLARTVLAAAS